MPAQPPGLGQAADLDRVGLAGADAVGAVGDRGAVHPGDVPGGEQPAAAAVLIQHPVPAAAQPVFRRGILIEAVQGFPQGFRVRLGGAVAADRLLVMAGEGKHHQHHAGGQHGQVRQAQHHQFAPAQRADVAVDQEQRSEAAQFLFGQAVAVHQRFIEQVLGFLIHGLHGAFHREHLPVPDIVGVGEPEVGILHHRFGGGNHRSRHLYAQNVAVRRGNQVFPRQGRGVRVGAVLLHRLGVPVIDDLDVGRDIAALQLVGGQGVKVLRTADQQEQGRKQIGEEHPAQHQPHGCQRQLARHGFSF